METPVDYPSDVESRGVVKSFYSAALSADRSDAGSPVPATGSVHVVESRARVAVYDAPAAAPRIVDIDPAPVPEYIESLCSTVYQLAKEQGGGVPYSVVREITENFIHASFSEPVVSILDSGHTIRFADHGPGIPDKQHATLPGFTTATGEMKRYIRGVGSGLPLVTDFLSFKGGGLAIEDNLGQGAVVTVSSRPGGSIASVADRSAMRPPVGDPDTAIRQNTLLEPPAQEDTRALAGPILTTRQKQVLALVMESGSAGPSVVSRELNVGVSTAYRDLASLEDLGLIIADGGKRSLTEEGLAYLDSLTSGL